VTAATQVVSVPVAAASAAVVAATPASTHRRRQRDSHVVRCTPSASGPLHRGASVADSVAVASRRYPTPISPVATGVSAADRPPTVRGVGEAAAGTADAHPPASRRQPVMGGGMHVAVLPAGAGLLTCVSQGWV